MKEKIIVIACVFLAVLLYLMTALAVDRVGYDIQKLKGDKDTLLVKYKVLLKEIDQLKASERIECLAKTKLNMCLPEKYEVLVLDSNAEKENSGWLRNSVNLVGKNVKGRIKRFFGGEAN